MPAAVLDLVGDNIIEANSFWSIDVLYPGNMTSSRGRGQIRKTYGGELIGTFRVENPVYDSNTNQTRFRFSLRSTETEKLPIPGEEEFWVYDIMIGLPSGDFRRVLKGKVSIDPGVTDV